MRKIWHTSGCGKIEIRIPEQAIRDIHQPGDAQDACEYWLGGVEWIRASNQDIAMSLRETGAWEDHELSDPRKNQIRYLWIAACDLGDMDESEWDDSEPVRDKSDD